MPTPQKEIDDMVPLYSAKMRSQSFDHTHYKCFLNPRLKLNPQNSITRKELSHILKSFGTQFSVLYQSLASFHTY